MAFEQDGYQVVRLPEIMEALQALRRDIYRIFDCVSRASGHGAIENDSDIIRFRTANQQQQYLAFRHLWFSPALFAAGGHPALQQLPGRFGFAQPVMEVPPQLRCDMPIEQQSVFQAHQDYTYNIGSANSVTLWIPLQDTSGKEGALEVVSGSHRNGIYANIRGIIKDSSAFTFAPCPLRFGEVLIMSQKLVHRSGWNSSDRIRFSMQLRFSDLACADYAKRGFPINHSITTDSYLEIS